MVDRDNFLAGKRRGRKLPSNRRLVRKSVISEIAPCRFGESLARCFWSSVKQCSKLQTPGLETPVRTGDRSGIRPDLLADIEDILGRLDQARMPQALNLPGYHLHPLKGELRGFWSVTVRANWRIVFRFSGEDALDVELIDYH